MTASSNPASVSDPALKRRLFAYTSPAASSPPVLLRPLILRRAAATLAPLSPPPTIPTQIAVLTNQIPTFTKYPRRIDTGADPKQLHRRRRRSEIECPSQTPIVPACALLSSRPPPIYASDAAARDPVTAALDPPQIRAYQPPTTRFGPLPSPPRSPAARSGEPAARIPLHRLCCFCSRRPPRRRCCYDFYQKPTGLQAAALLPPRPSSGLRSVLCIQFQSSPAQFAAAL